MTQPRIVGDLSDLPASGFRSHGMWYWAGAGFMLIEGTGFALAFATYLYIMAGSDQWPPTERAPDLLWGSLNTLLMVASLVPNVFTSNAARRRDLPAARFWVLVMALIAVGTLVLRALEFPSLNARWDHDAYGSALWAVLAMHTVHLATDFVDTAYLGLFLHTHPVDNERLSDVDDNAGYWGFIVFWQVAVYVLVYWAPRWSP